MKNHFQELTTEQFTKIHSLNENKQQSLFEKHPDVAIEFYNKRLHDLKAQQRELVCEIIRLNNSIIKDYEAFECEILEIHPSQKRGAMLREVRNVIKHHKTDNEQYQHIRELGGEA